MRRHLHTILAAGAIAAAAATARAAEPAEPSAAALEHFEKRVRPLLADNCYNCHSASTKAAGGLRVDDRNGLLKGGDSGRAVVPGDVAKSLLIQAVEQTGDIKMPPKKRLTDEQIAVLKQWVADGAAWPAVRFSRSVLTGELDADKERLKREHWAWRPLTTAAAPAVKDAGWPKDDVDRFVLAKLESKNLKPLGDADRGSLLRRVTFDLTGLPPTPEALDAFVKDPSPDAYATVVDRLLASPAFGERWGRHWLDVARYAESTGGPRNIPLPHAWRYRDYVIDSVNADKPFDRFLKEQVAGDLLPAETQKQRDEQTVATGFLALGVKDVNQRFKVRFVMDNVDEQIDTVSRSVLALTASCARCHDHKFDPVSQREYYALAGIFTSTDNCAGVRNKMGGGGLDYYDTTMLVPIGERKAVAADPAKVEQLRKESAEARRAFQAIRGKPEGLAKGPDGFPKQRALRLKAEAAQAELAKLTDPTQQGPVAFGARDAKEVGDTEVRIRGEAEKLGPVVPRGFPSLVRVPGAPAVNPKQSGRLELAEWLASPNNPLTARVFVNRAWHHLFGQGLVTTVDNFGVTGDKPSHPELLDYLAAEFVNGARPFPAVSTDANGRAAGDGRTPWSVKALVRKLVLTRAYQLSAETSPDAVAVDPANRLVWRHSPRRLTAEEIRDATLAAAGTLDAARPEGSPAQKLPMIEQRNNGPEAARFAELAKASTARSVYLPLLRGWVPTSLEVFDFAEQGMVTGSRDATTVAPQALYLLNDAFVRKQALALAERVLKATGGDGERIDHAYRLAVGRPATSQEVDRAKAFLAEYAAAAKDAVAAVAETPDAVAAAGKVAEPTADAGQAGGGGNAVIDPDQVVTGDAQVKEEVVRAKDATTAAWAAFAQALIGSAEFRYLK
ncbi:MAG TPA: PSD1 and planctomycete cytochrome C domain-containing protein [Humisphaera sp.]